VSASATDYFMKTGKSTATTLSAPGYTVGNTSINVGTTAELPTDTGIFIMIDEVETVGGVEQRVAGTYNVFRGTVSSGTQISGLVYQGGDTNRNYSAGATTRVYMTISSYHTNRMIDALLVSHDQDGTLKAGAVDNAAVITDSIITPAKFTTALQGDWKANLLPAVSSVTENGNRSADITFASTVASLLTPGMRLRTSRTVAAPTQCTDLESGSSQYFTKTSPNKLSFTVTWTAMGWVKLESYAEMGIIARRNADVEGWSFGLNASGQLMATSCRIAANNSQTVSYQSLPLGKWIHVAAATDLAGTTLMYIDGVLVPSLTTVTGTAATLVQGTTALVVGALKSAGTSPFDGKIAQAAVFSSKLSAATIASYKNQTLSGSESTIASAYSCNNSLLDLNTTTPNDLSASGGALMTNADSPFTVDANGVAAGTYDWGIVTKVATTVATVQYPEGCAIPTSGGISTVDYSGVRAPFGMPVGRNRWRVQSVLKTDSATTSNATWGAFLAGGYSLTLPTGEWVLGYDITFFHSVTTRVAFSLSSTALTGLAEGAEPSIEYTTRLNSAAASINYPSRYTAKPQSLSAAATYVMYTIGATTNPGINGASSPAIIFADCAHL